MRHRLLEENDGRRKFVLALAAGEEAVETITTFARQESLYGSSLTAIGAFSHARLGWFHPGTGEFVENSVDEQTEVLSMVGNIAIQDDQPKLHVHVVLGCRDAAARGGHLVAGWVRPTLEVILEESPEHLTRGVDADTGLVLLQP